MNQKAISLKDKINKGEICVGAVTSVDIGRDELKKIVETGEYDYLSIDSQHAPFNEEKIVEFCNMVSDLNTHVQFRIKHTRHSYLIGNMLDLGPQGIEVPQVELVETAEESVKNFYYPKVGLRSWGGTNRYGFGTNADRLEYAKWWNQYGVLWLQIESIYAVEKVNMFALPGVDCLSFGPADLTFNLESNPNYRLKNVDECVQEVVDKLVGTNTKVCFRNYTRETREKYIDMGVTVFLERP
jgi:2-keto-3-deoxy-L-rhamnonate aldolase RhmA